jgi:hypothetical protein
MRGAVASSSASIQASDEESTYAPPLTGTTHANDEALPTTWSEAHRVVRVTVALSAKRTSVTSADPEGAEIKAPMAHADDGTVREAVRSAVPTRRRAPGKRMPRLRIATAVPRILIAPQ